MISVALVVSADVHATYSIGGEDFVNVEISERVRSGKDIGGRSSNLNFGVADFRNYEIPDVPGLLKD